MTDLPMGVTRMETPTIRGGLVIRYVFPCHWTDKPEVHASRHGVTLGGAWPTYTDIAPLMAVLELAHRDYVILSGGAGLPS